MEKNLEILATPFDDPSLCRFTLQGNFIEEGELRFINGMKAPNFVLDLIKNLGVLEVIIEKNYLILKKPESSSWRDLARKVGKSLRLHHANGELVVSEEYLPERKQTSSTTISPNQEFLDSELGKKIKTIIEMQISPSLGSHGGSVTPIDFRDGELFVLFSGGCQGCSQVSVTVRDGIEKILKAKFPELEKVTDLTNHTEGNNPYFK